MARKIKTFPVVTCAVSNTPVQVYSDVCWVLNVTIQAESTNTGNIYVGDETVTTTTGVPVTPGDTCEIDVPVGGRNFDEISLNDIYIVSSTSGNKARIIAEVRKP